MKGKWPTIPLGDIAVTRGGSTNPAKFQDEFFELYSIPAYELGKPEKLIGREIGSSKKNVEPNDVLLSRIVPHIQRVWIVGEKDSLRQIASGEWIIYRSKKFYPPFLRNALLTKRFHAQFMQTISGVGGSLLRARPDQVAQIKIPLPPLPEQKRIAAILDKADAIRRKRQAAIKFADDFLRSTFLDMFGDPVTNPKGWEEAQLDDVAIVSSGVTKGRKFNNKPTVYVPYMRVANIQDGHIDLTEIKEIEVLESDVKKYALKPGDLLLTEGGDPDKLGRGAIWKGEIELCIHQNHIFKVRINNDYILPEYLSSLIGSSRGKRYFFRAAKQTTGIASINITQLRGFTLLLPPVNLQKIFVDLLRYRDKLLNKINININENEQLFNALAQRAFRGEL